MSSDFPRKGRFKQLYVQDSRVKLKKLICAWCSDIYNEPQRLYCGHTLCKSCLHEELQCAKSIKSNMRCKICRQVVQQEQIGEDKITKAIVDEIRVKCSAKKCAWQGLNKDYQDHYYHKCVHGQRTGEARYEYQYFSSRAQFAKKLNDDQEIDNNRPNMLHPSIKTSLREKIQKQWQVQLRYKDEEFMRKTKRLRSTFGN